MSRYLEDLRRGELRRELRARHLDATGEVEELRDRLESRLVGNGHDPIEYFFIDPVFRRMIDKLGALVEINLFKKPDKIVSLT